LTVQGDRLKAGHNKLDGIGALVSEGEKSPMEQLDYTLLDRQDISLTMFYPRSEWNTPPPGATDHMVPVNDEIVVSCRFYPCDKEAPSILYFHGNGEVVCDYDDLAPIYNHSRLNLFVADYRGYGASTGDPRFSTMVSDAHGIYSYLRNLLTEGQFVDRLYVMGRSLGAISALEVAAHYQDQLGGLILESGAGGGGWARWITASDDQALWDELQRRHLAKLQSIRLPLLTIHGEHDELIPLERALELRDLLSSEIKELLIVPGAGHNDIFSVGMQSYMEALQSFSD